VQQKVNLERAFASFSEHYAPRVAGELNGQAVKLAKLLGAFDWHHHEHEDELFLVHRGTLVLELRDDPREPTRERRVTLGPGEFLIVPRGTSHRPIAECEVELVLFEPLATLNTGNVRNERTLESLQRLDPRAG
jgi:mannose-6-phosphate isomerase-like protein (cupin superfamily)